MLATLIRGWPVAAASRFNVSRTEAVANYLLQNQARAQGGKASAKWTPEIDRLARAIFAENVPGNASLSHGAACRRVAA
jgi:hypothetical protein